MSAWILIIQPANAHSPEADSLINTIKELPVEEQVKKLLKYTKKNHYSNPIVCEQLVDQSLQLAESAGDPLLLSNALNVKAVMNFYRGNNEVAAKYIRQSIDYVKKVRRSTPDSTFLVKRLASLYGNAGNIYQALGNMELALESLLTSLRFSDTLLEAEPNKMPNIATRINALNSTAVVYRSLKETEKAEQLLTEALHLGRELDVPQALLPTLNNLGLIRIDQEKYTDAIDFYTEALELGRQVADSMGISGNFNNLGLIYEKLGNIRKALSYYLASLKITQRMGLSIGISNTCANIGRLYSELNMPDSAMFFVRKGIDKAISAGNNIYLMKNYETLSSIYEKTGEFNKALEMHKKFMRVKDSIFDIEKNKQIEKMMARFDSEKKEQENKLLKKNMKIQQRTKLLLIISLVAIVLIALLLYYFYHLKNKALKQQTKLSEQEQELHSLETARLEDQLFAEQQINKLQTEKLEQKNRELSSRILNAINKNDAMNKIIHELELLKIDGDNEVARCFGKVKQIVTDNISLDKDWEQFKLHFDEVNPGFFDALQQQFPQLSSGEQKLCAYYRINLDTKEIARILSVTPSAIQKSRHRLRKKMDIPSEVDLHEFMSRF
jgi:tetratricopeptide (TPR) repeat protein/DNA-binding CsgD family transcriptional regulator